MDSKLIRLIRWLVIGWLLAPPLMADFQPLIPMNYSANDIPMLEKALQDPGLDKQLLTDDLYFEQTFQEVKALQAELRSMRGPRRVEILKNLYVNYVTMSYFFEDLRAGRLTSQTNYDPIDSKVVKTRKITKYYAQQFAKFTKNPRLKAEALYHALTSQYLLGQNRSQVVRSLASLKDKLDGYLTRRVNLLIGIEKLKGGRRNRQEGKRLLRSIMKSLPLSGGIAARLALARMEAGLSGQGQKVRRADKAYRYWLHHATYRSRNQSKLDRSEVLAFSLAVWRRAETGKSSWQKPPFRLKYFGDLDLANAIVERAALAAASERQYQTAARRYQALSRKYQGSGMMGRIDRRILKIQELKSTRKGQPYPYQQALLKYSRKYQDSSFNRALGQQMVEEINRSHEQLVERVLQKGQHRNQRRAYRKQAIQVAQTYLQTQKNSAKELHIKEQIADIHVLLGQHRPAVALYLELKNKHQDQQSFRFLNLAINSQSKLANWPMKPVWRQIKKGESRERQTLATMYTEKFQQTQNWNDLANLGLLWLNLGKHDKAFSLWSAHLQKQPAGPQAQRAAGYMMVSYRQAKQWQSLEDVTRLSLQTRLTPIHRNRPMNAMEFLANALFYVGKELFDQQQWAGSVSKLKEFTTTFTKDKRRPEGMFFLAQGYHNNANHPESIETIMSLVNEYPTSRFIREALVLGGQWSIPMAYEEQTIFFYQKFIDRFSSDKRTPKIREKLVDLYMGRDLYGHAARVYKAHSQDPKVDRQTQVKAALAVMNIEERFGETKYARWGAQRVKKIGSDSPATLAQVYGFETRVAAKKGDLKTVRRLERQLEGLPLSEPEVVQALAQVRFILAEKEATTTKNEFFNLALKSPRKTLEKQFGLFVNVQKAYESVCEAGNSSYCAPAMMRLSETTQNTLDAIEEISIAQTLGAKQVEKFEKRKLGIVSYLAEVAAKADNRALGMSADGKTTPDWSREIMWVNSNEWNFDETQPTSGNGYVQWAPAILTSDESTE